MHRKRSKFTTADLITISRVFFAPIVIGLFLLGYNYIAAGVYCLGALTDALDGYVARKYKQVTDYGSYLDALVDRIFVIPILLALVLTGTLKSWVITTLIIIAVIELGLGAYLAKNLKKNYLCLAHRNSIRTFAVFIYFTILLYLLKFTYADHFFIIAVCLGIFSFFDYVFYIKKNHV